MKEREILILWLRISYTGKGSCIYIERRKCLPCSTREEYYIMQSIYNRCREGNVSREKEMSSVQESTPIKKIHVSTSKKKNFGFRLAFVSPSSSSSPSSLFSSSSRLVLFYFARAQPSKKKLLSWYNISQVISLVSYAIVDRRQSLNPLRIWRYPHSF